MCLPVYYHPDFLGRDSVTRPALIEKLFQQLQSEFGKQVLERAQGKLQLQHLSLECPGWLCLPGPADTIQLQENC